MPPAVIAGGIAAVGAVGGSAIMSGASKKAAKTSAEAANRSADVQLQMFRENAELQAPWRQQGIAALNQYSQLLGLPAYQAPRQTNYLGSTAMTSPGYLGREDYFGQTPTSIYSPSATAQAEVAQPEAAPDYSAFFKTPGYQFQLDEATKASERAAAARGTRLSGGQIAELQRIAQGQAAGGYLTYMNQLASLAGLGQSSAAQTGAMGQQAAAGAGAAYQSAGNAQAGGYLGSASAIGQGLAGVGQGLGTIIGYYGNQASPSTAMPAVSSFPALDTSGLGLTGTFGAQGVYGGMPIPGGI